MKNVSAYTIIALMAISIGLYAQENNTTREKQKSVYQIFCEGTVRDTIIDVIYDMTEMTVENAMNLGVNGLEDKNLADIVMIQYPKVVMVGDTNPGRRELTKWIKFYSSNREMKNALELDVPRQKCIISTNKKLIAIRNILSRGSKFDEITIYDQEGTEIRTHMIERLDYVLLADDGSFVVYGGRIGEVLVPAALHFHNPAGELVKEVQTNSCLFYAKYTPDEQYVILLITGHGKNMGLTTDMVCFNRTGDELWKCNIADLPPNELNNIYFALPYGILNFSDDSKEIHIRAGSDSKGDKKRIWIFSINNQLLGKEEGWER